MIIYLITNRCTETHTNIYRHKCTDTHLYTEAPKHRPIFICTHRFTHRHTQHTHRHTVTHIHRHMHTRYTHIPDVYTNTTHMHTQRHVDMCHDIHPVNKKTQDIYRHRQVTCTHRHYTCTQTQTHNRHLFRNTGIHSQRETKQ